MNETTTRQLMVAVERAVRPVQAGPARKQRMREELLAHLIGLYQEESRNPGGPEDALARATRRLGVAAELEFQLQRSVPRAERVVGYIEELLRFRPGESTARRATRLGFLMFATSAPVPLILMPAALTIRGKPIDPATVAGFFACYAAPLALLAFVFTFLMHAMRKALARSPKQRWPFTLGVLLLSYLPVPCIGFVMNLAFTGDPVKSIHDIGLLLMLSMLAPACLFVAARETGEKMRYQEEWAQLELGNSHSQSGNHGGGVQLTFHSAVPPWERCGLAF